LDVDDSEAGSSYIEWESKLYQILECSICKDTFGRKRQRQLHLDTDPLTGLEIKGYYYSEEYHPRRLINTLLVKEFKTIPSILLETYEEVIFCYNNNKLIICSSGLKTIIEGICIYFRKKNNPRNLSGICQDVLNMPILESLKYVSNFYQYSIFHKLHNPNKSELRLAIELIEDLLSKLFSKDLRLD
jgi:hypothetical protein